MTAVQDKHDQKVIFKTANAVGTALLLLQLHNPPLPLWFQPHGHFPELIRRNARQ